MFYSTFRANYAFFRAFKTSYTLKSIASTGALTALYFHHQNSHGSVQNSVQPHLEHSVTVDKGAKDIGTQLTFHDGSQWSLMGYGVRAVTFLKFKIYALSIYSDAESIGKVDAFFTRNSIQKVDLSENVVVDLLEKDGGVKFLARITPLRNTTFEHLREGMIRSAMSSEEAKLEPEAMVSAVKSFREEAMNRNGSVLVDDDLYLVKNKDNSLVIYHFDNKMQEYHFVGKCSHQLFGIALFSKYLNYDSPLSSAAQRRFSDFFKL